MKTVIPVPKRFVGSGHEYLSNLMNSAPGRYAGYLEVGESPDLIRLSPFVTVIAAISILGILPLIAISFINRGRLRDVQVQRYLVFEQTDTPNQ